MIDIRENRILKYLLFGNLYFSEGLILAVETVIIPIYFIEKGISLPLTAFIIGITSLPWALKFIFGGISDYFIGFGRKRFIIIGGLIGAIGSLILAFIDPATALLPFTIILFISHCGIAFLDVAADAWAIEISSETERGKINGAMFAGQFAGMAIGASLLAYIAQIFEYNIAFLTGGLIIFSVILFPLFIKEIKVTVKHRKIGSLLIGEFKKKTTQLIAIFAPISAISAGFLILAIPMYMKVILKLEISQIGLIASVFPIAVVAGSLVGGAIADIWTRKATLFVFIGASIVFTSLLVFADTWLILAVIYGIIGFLQGGYVVPTSAMCMDITNPKVGATQFSILMSSFNIGEILGASLAGSLVLALGFDRFFLYSAWIFGPALLILYFIRLKKKPIKNKLF